jgi:hypothetical protein
MECGKETQLHICPKVKYGANFTNFHIDSFCIAFHLHKSGNMKASGRISYTVFPLSKVIFTKVILAQQLLVKTSYPDLTFGKDLIP